MGNRLDDAPLREIGDVLLGVAERGQDLLVVLAELGGGDANRQALGAVRDRMPEERYVRGQECGP